jgi:poly(3-hydroxybutyrate) depolymerase
MTSAGPSRRLLRRRRIVALTALTSTALAVYLVLAATVFAPVNKQGARVVHLTLRSQEVDRKLGVNVVVPAQPGRRGERPLLVFLHGRSGDESTFTGDEAVFDGLRALERGAPIVAFPDGGVQATDTTGTKPPGAAT